MRSLIALVIFAGVGSVPSTVFSQEHCAVKKYQQAEVSLVTAEESWLSLAAHHRRFRTCDDGALAEGYSDAVVKLLAHRWDHFDEFVKISSRNSRFRKWALGHIDASASIDDLDAVARNTKW